MNYIIASLLAMLVLTPSVIMMAPSNAFASLGMGNCQEDPDEECVPQKERTGNDHSNDDDPTNDEDADRDGPDEQEDSNCWGKVTSDFTTTKDGDGGGDMSHASDPVGGDEDQETPREGVGNQNEGHPSDHADTVGPQFGSDEECTQD